MTIRIPDMSGGCRAKIGLLVLRDCGAEARELCPSCSRPICKQHRVKTATGIRCPECCAKDQQATEVLPVRRARQRDAYYDRYDYRPYYYGYDHTPYFHDYDYRTFDDGDAVDYDPLGEIEPGLQDTDEGRDWLGLDDFGES